MPAELATPKPELKPASPSMPSDARKKEQTLGTPTALDLFLDRLVRFFSSLRLTVVCLGAGLILVFTGTLAQVDLGLFRAQNEFFRSFFVYWRPGGGALRIPVFPGGYLVGGVLLLNLITAHWQRFKFTAAKAGIWIIHGGLILLLLGQLLTDMLSHESGLRLAEGETKNFSEDFRKTELALADTSEPKNDTVYAIAERMLSGRGEIRDSRLPFAIRVKNFWPNASLVKPGPDAPAGAVTTGATAGELKDTLVLPRLPVSGEDERNYPAAVIELLNGEQSAGSFVLWSGLMGEQSFTANGKTFQIALRFARYYYPFSLTLLKATHEKYKGTTIPKNFASRVRIEDPARNETRETDIYMNNPLRYSGLTFFQYQMLTGEEAEKAGQPPSSTLQVVHNPSWLTPYLSCILVATGLMVQFGSHLFKFLKRQFA